MDTVKSKLTLPGIAIVTLLFQFLGASPVVARAPSPPAFIHSTSMREEFVGDWSRLVASSVDAKTMNREGSRILRDAYGSGRFHREFPRGFKVDLSRPDTQKIATNFLKGNPKNWHGYSRELKVLSHIRSSRSPFNLIEAGSRTKFRGKTTEFDALLERKRSKLRAVIEVKDRQIASSKDLRSAKDQITRIAKRAGRERVGTVSWVNRQVLPPKTLAELTKHAHRHGVSVYHNVTTGVRQVGLGGSRSLEGVMRGESMKLNRIARAQSPMPRLSPVALTGSSRLIARRVGGPLLGAASIGMGVYRFQTGGTNTRAAISGVATASGAFVGGAAGAKGGAIAGAAIGTAFPGIGTAVGATAGGIIGGIGGAIGGGMIAGTVADSFTQNFIANLDAEGQRDLIKALRQKYAEAL